MQNQQVQVLQAQNPAQAINQLRDAAETAAREMRLSSWWFHDITVEIDAKTMTARVSRTVPWKWALVLSILIIVLVRCIGPEGLIAVSKALSDIVSKLPTISTAAALAMATKLAK